MKYPEVVLNKEGIKKYLSGNLWFSRKDISNFESLIKKIEPGSLVRIISKEGIFAGIGYFNPRVFYSLKLLTKEEVKIDKEFFIKCFKDALSLRKRLFSGESSFRLLFGEGDFIPGLIVDIFENLGVVQIYTLGIERLKEVIIEALCEVLPLSTVVLKNTAEKRKEEGLRNYVEVVKGCVQEPVLVNIDGIKFLIPVLTGQKTGFFLDQRENRKFVAGVCKGKEVADCFCYTGGFGFYALKAGAKRVFFIDTSEKALFLVEEIARLNNWEDRVYIFNTDVFQYLKTTREIEILILDPPAFIKSHRDIKKGEKKYENLFLAGISRAGEFCFFSSCSHFLSRERFLELIFKCLKKEGREGVIVYQGFQSPDHPIHPFVKETFYLKSVLLKL